MSPLRQRRLREAIRAAGLAAVAAFALSGATGARRRVSSPSRAGAAAAGERALSARPRVPGVFDGGARGLRRGLMLPLAREAGLRGGGDAMNVTALDEVPDSGWFTNREPTPAQTAEGACAGVPAPAPPYVVLGAKDGGATSGFRVRDAGGREWMFKFDQRPREQPGLTTAADAVASRLYWAAGYYTPCNTVTYVRREEFSVAPDARDATEASVARRLASGTPGPGGTVRAGASAMVPGEPLGPWPGEGVRADDANDTVPHQHRRELRGERLFAAWVHRWDVRDANGLDAYEPLPGGGGRVVHYMLDFGDAIGARPFADVAPGDVGRRPSFDPAGDALRALGLRASDPAGEFRAAGFDPAAWVPLSRSARFANATDADLAWAARRLARITPEHVRAAVAAGRFESDDAAARVADALVGRRDAALRWSFARVSPLDRVALSPGGAELCAVDLAVASGTSAPGAARYEVEYQRGPRLETARPASGEGGRVCARAPRGEAVVDFVRAEGTARTRLRVWLGAGAGGVPAIEAIERDASGAVAAGD